MLPSIDPVVRPYWSRARDCWVLITFSIITLLNSNALELWAQNAPSQKVGNGADVVIELLSDPAGTAFSGYIEVVRSRLKGALTAAPKGGGFEEGTVVLQFSVTKSGAITRLAIDGSSGSQLLDQGATNAVSFVNPLPMLPLEFKGSQVVLRARFVFHR